MIEFAGTALLAWTLVARAQQQAKSARLGYLGFGTAAASATRVEPLRAGLRDLGYVEGKNLVIEFRWSGTAEQMHETPGSAVRCARCQRDPNHDDFIEYALRAARERPDVKCARVTREVLCSG